ncbi:MAG: hypothetical protein ACTSUT_00135 [Promethearchaeota archaeon]
MKITIKKRVVASASLRPKLKVKYKTVDEVVEISDKLINKTIAVIDELLDRTWDDWEERGRTGLDFPLVPFPFFEKSRLPENVGIDDYWVGFWLDTDLQNIITERAKIIKTLKEIGGIERINHDPVINLTVPVFDGDKFELCINRNKLVFLRELIVEKQQKLKIEGLKKNSKDKDSEKIKNETKNYLLSKNNNGDYFYKDTRIKISSQTVYYKVFDSLYSERNQEGFLSYEDIENLLIERLVPELKNKQERNKRINNAISTHQGFFRYAKVNSKKLKNKIPDGKKLIEIVRGKGLKLNNPII